MSWMDYGGDLREPYLAGRGLAELYFEDVQRLPRRKQARVSWPGNLQQVASFADAAAHTAVAAQLRDQATRAGSYLAFPDKVIEAMEAGFRDRLTALLEAVLN